MNAYEQFLASKAKHNPPAGFEPGELPDCLFPHQRAIVQWACRMGRAAVFADTGLGKTLMLLAWADQVRRQTGGSVLVLAPLAVAQQTVEEAERFGIPSVYLDQAFPDGSIVVTNYQKLHRFDSMFAGVVLDESSILKSHDGKTRNQLIETFAATPYKLCCTATPAPNDHEELGNHCEFLGIMSRVEMLATYFVHDSGDTSEWRLKGHAERDFWRWVATWAILCRKPSDLGFDDAGYDLPPLQFHEHHVEAPAQEGNLFAMPETTLTGQRKARKLTMGGRATTAARIAKECDGPALIWCELNAEQDALERELGDACVSVRGQDKDEQRLEALRKWKSGEAKVLVTKPGMFGHGLNWQHCSQMVFAGLSHSYEQFYQAVRRCWRYGQTKPVHVHLVTSDLEAAVLANVRAKQADHERMVEGMLVHTRDVNREQLGATVRQSDEYRTATAKGERWELYNGDCVELVRSLPSASVDYSCFSPPFSSLYTYSNSPRDMGNCKDDDSFFTHFGFLIDELFRVLKPGRLVSFHCMNLPTSKERDGYIGIRDFRGDLIYLFAKAGFIYHSEVCIWKDPVTAMQRTKALGLLHKQLKKDSCMSRQGIADYVVSMRKPGANPEPVSHTNESFPVSVWQRYASPVWMDIDQTNVLNNYREGREENDERHICPLQLDVIERCLKLWSNPGDLVLSPFAGIGSEGYQAIKFGRRFVGAELKPSYFEQAVKNLKRAEDESRQRTLFDGFDDDEAA